MIRYLGILCAGLVIGVAVAPQIPMDSMFGAANSVFTDSDSRLLAQRRGQERRDDRDEDQDGRQDCRQEEGRLGGDTRDCRQDERKGEGDAEPEGEEG